MTMAEIGSLAKEYGSASYRLVPGFYLSVVVLLRLGKIALPPAFAGEVPLVATGFSGGAATSAALLPRPVVSVG